MTQTVPLVLPADWRDFFALTKPRVMSLVIFTGLCGLLAAPGSIHPVLGFTAILCIALGAGGAAALNQWWEADLDAGMKRTAKRPLPAGRMQRGDARDFGIALSVASVLVMGLAIGWLAAGILALSILYYAVVYTIWLKPRTPFAVIVGGISGAIAPLIADAAVTGHIGVVGWTLFAIIFVWQPPHFYAIALFRREDYARANFPMLPDRIGVDATVNRIVIWAVGLVGVTLLPFFWLGLGYLYLVVALVLGAICLQKAFRLRARKDDASARGFFLFSLIHLLGCFAAMILDLALGAWL